LSYISQGLSFDKREGLDLFTEKKNLDKSIKFSINVWCLTLETTTLLATVFMWMNKRVGKKYTKY
jgi:hypothetical protein